jgi:putative tricarboxylic transport membrane protein
MRVGFLLAVLAAAVFYSYFAFAELAFLSRTGRLGPGFFPRIIGVGLIAVCLLGLPQDIARMRSDDMRSAFWPSVLVVAALSAGMIWLFTLVGGTLAMAVFLLAALSFLNRGRVLQNVAIAVLLPLGVYFLFDVWLNASMPKGYLPLPI